MPGPRCHGPGASAQKRRASRRAAQAQRRERTGVWQKATEEGTLPLRNRRHDPALRRPWEAKPGSACRQEGKLPRASTFIDNPSDDRPVVVNDTGGSGAAEGTRTPDPIITNDVLYQLSYSGLVAGY